jgi:hypothetical protein
MSARYLIKEKKNPLNKQSVFNCEEYGGSQYQIIGKQNIRILHDMFVNTSAETGALLYVMLEHLSERFIVHFGDFMSLRACAAGEGSVKEPFYCSFMIDRMSVLFRSDNNRREKPLNSNPEKTLT